MRIPFAKSLWASFLSAEALDVFFRSGGQGVRIFFVISGYLITVTSLKRWGELGRLNARTFYRIRFARIAPCLGLLLLTLSVLHLLRVDGYEIDAKVSTLPRALVSALTFHVNWLEGAYGYLPGAWDILWTLSVEEMFYLFFPVACICLRKTKYLVPLLLAFVILGPFSRTVFTDSAIWKSKAYLSCMDGIAFGCLAALSARTIKLKAQTSRLIFVFGSALALFVLVFRGTASRLGLSAAGLNPTVLALGTALVLLALSPLANERPALPLPRFRILRGFGINSYEIYLTHMFVVLAATTLFNALAPSPDSAPLWHLAVLCSSLLVGDFLRKYFSEPMNRWLRNQKLRLTSMPASVASRSR